SSLPGVILISTVFRLALTVATTRLILAEGEAGTIDADQVARQPERQRHERAEGEEIVEGEAPDLQVLQRREFLPEASRGRGLAGTATIRSSASAV
ncbi:hypothetical protein EN855_036670, partial [Mesorhizobium sp. M1C.F.Ca.ET.212.01.1.1]